MEVWCDRVDVVVVPQSNVLILVGAEVVDDFPAFGHRDVELVRIHSIEKEASIRTDDLEIRARTRWILEIELERSADGDVQEPEPILPRFHFEIWPRLSIRMNDISKEIGGLSIDFRTPKRPVRIVALAAYRDRDVILPLRQAGESRFLLVTKKVETRLAKICVFSSMIDSVIVVPEGSPILAIWIVIVLVLVPFGDVFSPAVKGSPGWRVSSSVEFQLKEAQSSNILTVRSMEMNRISTISMIDEAHDSFTTLGHHQGRTGGNSIVSNQASLAEVGINLLLKWFDVDLVVVNWWVAKRSAHSSD